VSAIGTGIAAAVAQTGLQSQQVARQRDKRESNRTRQAQQDTEIFETRLLGLEEHDSDEAATRLHVDNQQPDREHPDDQRVEDHAEAQDQGAEHAALAQAQRLPDSQELLQQLADAADPTVQQQAARAAVIAPAGAGAPAEGADPSALYTHIDIKA